MTSSSHPACPDTYQELRGFHAFHNTMPPGPPSLYVIGTVVVSTAGYTVKLTDGPIGINPTILLLELHVRKPDAPAADVVEEHPVRWNHAGEYNGGYSEVHVLCGSNIVQKVPVEIVT